MLNFYIASVIITFVVILISNEAITARMKREGVYYKEKQSAFEIIVSFFPIFIPFFNVLLILIIIFSYEEVYKRCVEKVQERKRIIEGAKKHV